MKIQHLRNAAGSRTARIVLETDEERMMLHSELMLIVDNGRGLEYDRDTNSYRIVGDLGAARHFGGKVVNDPADPDARIVTVYID